jgi:hypothetical protein
MYNSRLHYCSSVQLLFISPSRRHNLLKALCNRLQLNLIFLEAMYKASSYATLKSDFIILYLNYCNLTVYIYFWFCGQLALKLAWHAGHLTQTVIQI